jgi:hypothetical protein
MLNVELGYLYITNFNYLLRLALKLLEDYNFETSFNLVYVMDIYNGANKLN